MYLKKDKKYLQQEKSKFPGRVAAACDQTTVTG
jgi:hypothetical protein